MRTTGDRRAPMKVTGYVADRQLEAVQLGGKTLQMRVDSIELFIDARPVGNTR